MVYTCHNVTVGSQRANESLLFTKMVLGAGLTQNMLKDRKMNG